MSNDHSCDPIPGSEILTDEDVVLVTGGTGLFGKVLAYNQNI